MFQREAAQSGSRCYSHRGPSGTYVLDVIRSNPGVGLIFIRKNNALFSDHSELPQEAEIEVSDRFENKGVITVRRDPFTQELLYSYESLTDQDPLQYGDLGREGKRFRTYNEWNDLSVQRQHYYHNVVAGMGSYLYSKNPAIGDISLMRAQGWNFGDNCGGHGGVHRDEKLTVMMLSGPGIQAGELMARSKWKTVAWHSDLDRNPEVQIYSDSSLTYPTVVDLVPTILNWLGYGEEALTNFAHSGFSQHLQAWDRKQAQEFPRDAVSLVSELAQKMAPNLGLKPSNYAGEFSRLLQFIPLQQPHLEDLNHFHEDGNQLSL